MNKNIDEILKKIYPNENTEMYETRFNVLYSLVFELANSSEYATIKNEIELCELGHVKDTGIECETYKELSPEIVLQMYIGLAFSYAKLRVEKKTPIVCAKYLKKIFCEFLENNFMTKESKSLYKRNISEALLDFSYASGETDNMSFRLHDLLR